MTEQAIDDFRPFVIEGTLTELHTELSSENLLRQVAKHYKTRRGDVLIAHALLCEQQGFVWIKHPWGLRAERMANFKLGFWLAIFASTCFITSDFFLGPFTPELNRFEFMALTVLASSAICVLVGVGSNSDMKSLAGPATEIFRMLGFADPKKINLNSYRYCIVRVHELVQSSEMQHTHHDVYCYKKAIENGKLKFAA